MPRNRRKKHYSRSEREQLKERAQAAEAKRRLARIPVAVDGPAGQAPGTWRSHRSDPQTMVDSGLWLIEPDLRERLVSIYQVALDRRPGLTDIPYAQGLHWLGQGSWLREPAAWRPGGRGLTAAFRSLAGHLLGEYRISPWLWDTLLGGHWWESVPAEAVRFLAAHAGGRSVRTLAGTEILPAQLTRRMCHLLTTPPHRMGFVAMVRRAQVLGCGGTEQLARSLHLMELCEEFRSDESYWADVIHWLCRQDLPDRRTINPAPTWTGSRQTNGPSPGSARRASSCSRGLPCATVSRTTARSWPQASRRSGR
ncbi:MAG: hypothetical protein LC667_01465 [Thioalkalivibrio sp.]|nr:hypothetical protein [Thioalkalivibrio sp.]